MDATQLFTNALSLRAKSVLASIRLFQTASGDERHRRFRIECKRRCVDAIRSFAIRQ